MTKYVLDLPEGVKFIVGKGYMMLSEKELLRIPVENLQEYSAPTVAENATVEKPVIELPAQVIHVLKHMKTVSADSVDFAMALDTYKGKTELFRVEQSVHKISDMYVSWYLGHVEFVAKKEPKFIVEVKIGTATKKALLSDANYVAFYSDPEHAPSGYQYLFSDEQADELVAGLTALNARKVKVEE